MRAIDTKQAPPAHSAEHSNGVSREAGAPTSPLKSTLDTHPGDQSTLVKSTPMTLEEHERLAATFAMPKVPAFVVRHMYAGFAVTSPAPVTRRRTRRKLKPNWLTPPDPIVPPTKEGR